MTAVWVAILGALGSLCRYGTGLVGARLFGANVPAATFAVNLLGSAAIGFVMAYFGARGALASPARIALTAGFMGGFTTYSAFCYETFAFVERGAWGAAALYVVATVVLCFGACALGVWLGRMA